MKHLASGKVREIFELDDTHLVLVSTDRISAFDVIFNERIDDKGRILTALSKFWLDTVANDLPNHFVSLELSEDERNAISELCDFEPNELLGRTMVVRKAEMIPLEVIVRGYLAGSAWKEYQASGTIHGQQIREGLELGDSLGGYVVTASTKGEVGEHDVNLNRDQAIELVGEKTFARASELALTMFERASKHSESRGLILADTKFEFGFIEGELAVCDEILTPDSSRYWPTNGWLRGTTPPAFDKQLLRDWLETTDWDKTPPAPELPDAVAEQTRDRYVKAYEMLTDNKVKDLAGYSRS